MQACCARIPAFIRKNGAARKSRAGAEIAKQKTNEQTALFATNSGRRLLNPGDIDGAISQFRKAIQTVPKYAPAHYQLGLALERKGDKDGGPGIQGSQRAGPAFEDAHTPVRYSARD